ncbi:MAG: cytochrome C [Chitinophagaceae bacterium]|nr:cytochrome C [Chitinophagaceae bacterium]
MKLYLWRSYIFLTLIAAQGCHPETTRDNPKTGFTKTASERMMENITPLPGKNDSVDMKAAQQGEALISYSDCYTCHKADKLSVGPPFKAIAKRYPANGAYKEMLAQKIMLGGSGIWGSAVMIPHPDISREDAKLMALYIFSLKE